jgi:hypothetical protein
MQTGMGLGILNREVREFRGRVHGAENRLIRGLDREKLDGANGIGRAFAKRDKADWRVELAIGVGRAMMAGMKHAPARGGQ